MKQEILATRYLDAFLNCYADGQKVDALKGLSSILEVILSDAAAFDALNSPIYDEKHKLVLLKKIAGSTDELTQNFLSLLVKKKRVALVAAINELIEDRILELQNLVQLNLFSSSPLKEDQLKHIETFGKSYFNKNVEINQHIDESIMAGFKIESKDVKFDGTLRHSLNELALSFKGGR